MRTIFLSNLYSSVQWKHLNNRFSAFICELSVNLDCSLILFWCVRCCRCCWVFREQLGELENCRGKYRFLSTTQRTGRSNTTFIGTTKGIIEKQKGQKINSPLCLLIPISFFLCTVRAISVNFNVFIHKLKIWYHLPQTKVHHRRNGAIYGQDGVWPCSLFPQLCHWINQACTETGDIISANQYEVL